jgi:hypothetical protein
MIVSINLFVFTAICVAADGIQCVESGNNTFLKEIPCLWTYVLQVFQC